jgi:tape measure domain-containing protein
VAQQINATMSTKIALDLLSASESVKSLTAVVRSSQNAWKAQEAEMKSAGDAVGAAQAKYDGLGKSIDSQQAKIDALKSKQSELKGNTADVAQQFLKYQQQIDGATKQLASMQAQQDRAKQAMDYQKSGLAGLQQEYTAAARANQVYVTRLEAEGRQQEADKAKMEGYKSSITNLNEQLSKQSAELDKIASASGKDSNAWRTQKTRVDETATSLAHAKSSMANLSDEMKKMNPSPWARLKSSITETNDKAEKTHSIFHEVFSADMASNIVQSAWQHLSGWIGSAVDSAKEYSLAQQTMNATWTTLTGNASEGKKMVDMTDQMAISANNATEMVDQLNQKFFAINHSAEGTKSLTKSVLTLQDAFGQTDDAVMNFGTQFAQMMANGKVSSQDMMSFVNTFPVLRTNLLKTEQQITGNHNLSMKQMNDMMSAGQISSSTMEKVLESTAKEYGKATENFGKTIPGMIRTAKSQMPVLLSAISDPLTKAANPVVGAVSNWVASPKTKTAFSSLGKTFSDGLNKAISSMSGGASNGAGMTKALDNGIQGLQKTVSGFFGFLATHGKDLAGITGSLGSILKIFAGTIWHTISGIVSSIAKSLVLMGSGASKAADPLKNANTALGNIAKNKRGIQTLAKTLLGLWATVKIVKFTAAIAGAFKGLTALRGIKDFGALSKLSGAGGLGGATKVLGSLKLLLTGPGGIVLAVAAAGLAFYEAYKHIKPFHDAVNNVAKTIVNALKPAFKAVVAGAQSMWKSIQPILNQIGKLFKTTWELVVKVIQVAWKAIKPIVDLLVGLMKGSFELIAKVIGGLWKGTWDTVGTALKAAWKLIKDVLSSGIKVITDILKVGLDLLSGNWGKAWSDIKSALSDYWKGMKRIVGDVFGGIHDIIKSVLGAIGDVWNSAWSGMKSFFGDIWDGIKNAAADGMNAVINVINGAISGINWVWKKFTGKDALKKLSHVHFANGGTVTQKMHMVMVNDGAGEDWKELYQLPNGQVGMSQKRNATGLLPEGTRVFNGKETKAIMNMAGIEHYDLGGVVGNIGKFFSGAWDKAKEVADWLAHPIENVGKLIKSSVSGISGGIEMFSKLAGGVIGKLTGSVVDWFKKELKKLQDTLGDAGGGKGAPSGSGVQRWAGQVKEALAANGLGTSDSMVNRVLRQIKTESGGNEKARQPGADPDGDGSGPALGLMQTKMSTFLANAFPGHGNIWNGYDNMLAGLNYAKHRYGSSLSFLGQGHGYANGGIVRNWQYAQIAEHNKPEAVIPLEAAKDSRAWQVLKAVVDAKTGGESLDSNNSGSTSNADSKIAELTNTVNQMAMMMKTIIGLNADQIAATKGIGTFDQNKFYKKMATDQGLSDYQSLA